MRFRYDPESGAMYARIREGRIAETLELGGGCYLDVGEDGTVMGLECLSLDEFRELIERSNGELDLPDRVLDAEKTFELSEADTLSLEEVLDPAQRRVIELHFVKGLTYAETADAIGVSISTVYRRLQSGLETLRESGWVEAHGGQLSGRVALSEGGRLLSRD